MKKTTLLLLLISFYSKAQTFNFQRSWGTYFGDYHNNIIDSKVDRKGDLYLVGVVKSYDGYVPPIITLANSFQPIYGGGDTDGYIAKFNNQGQLVWMTYFGGEGSDEIDGIDIDTSNNIYIVGTTTSVNNIASTNAYQTLLNGSSDFIIGKFTENGTRIWSSYFGGSGGEFAYPGTAPSTSSAKRLQISHDKFDSFYIAGYSMSPSMGDQNTFQPQQENTSCIITKFSNNGVKLWTTYYGYFIEGVSIDSWINGLSADQNGLYVRGTFFQYQPSFPYNNYFGDLNGVVPNPNVMYSSYLSKFDVNGNRIWSDYYGQRALAYANSIAVYQDKIYFTGSTSQSSLITTTNSFQENLEGGSSPFLVQYNEDGTRGWGTFNGNNINDPINSYSGNASVTIDNLGGIYMSGRTNLNNNVATEGAYQTNLAGGESDGYVSKFDVTGQKIWGTYYGGENQEMDMICHPYDSSFFLVGITRSSTGITTPGAYQTELPTNTDVLPGESQAVFIAHFEPLPLTNASFENTISIFPNPVANEITVLNTNKSNETFNYKIIDVTGRIIQSGKSVYNNKITVEEVTSGNYIIQIQDENGFVANKKLIKK